MGTRRRSYVRLYYHYVWGTKNRERIISENVESLIQKSFALKSADLNISILENGGVADHVHLLVALPATMAPADIARHLKGASSHFVNEQMPGLSFRWQDGYGVVSVSPGNLRAIRKYIRGQKEHHKEEKTEGSLELDSEE